MYPLNRINFYLLLYSSFLFYLLLSSIYYFHLLSSSIFFFHLYLLLYSSFIEEEGEEFLPLFGRGVNPPLRRRHLLRLLSSYNPSAEVLESDQLYLLDDR